MKDWLKNGIVYVSISFAICLVIFFGFFLFSLFSNSIDTTWGISTLHNSIIFVSILLSSIITSLIMNKILNFPNLKKDQTKRSALRVISFILLSYLVVICIYLSVMVPFACGLGMCTLFSWIYMSILAFAFCLISYFVLVFIFFGIALFIILLFRKLSL